MVIFLPDLMDGNKLEQKDEAFAKIPLRPELELAKPALQVSAAEHPAPAEHLASQQQAPPRLQWQVEEIGDTVTLANQAGTNLAATNQAPVTQQQPGAGRGNKPKPQPKPGAQAGSDRQEAGGATQAPPVPPCRSRCKKPVEAKPQAGQISNPWMIFIGEQDGPAGPGSCRHVGPGKLDPAARCLQECRQRPCPASKLRAAGYWPRRRREPRCRADQPGVFIGPDVQGKAGHAEPDQPDDRLGAAQR